MNLEYLQSHINHSTSTTTSECRKKTSEFNTDDSFAQRIRCAYQDRTLTSAWEQLWPDALPLSLRFKGHFPGEPGL